MTISCSSEMFRFCFNSKATQNARFEQMTKQQQLIEQKKQEIQKKIEEKKRKETEEALKKINPQPAAVVDRRGPSSSSSKNRWRGYVNSLFETINLALGYTPRYDEH